MKVHADDLFAALVTAIGYQTDNEVNSQKQQGPFRKSQFLKNLEKMLDAVKRGEQLQLVYPDDLNELG